MTWVFQISERSPSKIQLPSYVKIKVNIFKIQLLDVKKSERPKKWFSMTKKVKINEFPFPFFNF